MVLLSVLLLQHLTLDSLQAEAVCGQKRWLHGKSFGKK